MTARVAFWRVQGDTYAAIPLDADDRPSYWPLDAEQQGFGFGDAAALAVRDSLRRRGAVGAEMTSGPVVEMVDWGGPMMRERVLRALNPAAWAAAEATTP